MATTVRARARTRFAAKKKPQVSARAHNSVLDAAQERVDRLEPRLASVVEEILRRAGTRAANLFHQRATRHDSVPDPSLIAAAANADVAATAAVIALKPRPSEAAALADPAGDPPEILHVTLAYLGDTDQPLQEIADALKPVAATHGPLSGVVGGVGMFQPAGVGIALLDVRGLAEARQAVVEALHENDIDYGRDHGFTPHITINGDGEAPDPDLSGRPLHFDSLYVVRGNDEEIELPLVGVRALTAAGPTWSPPFPDELLDVDALVQQILAKTEPVRKALIEQTMTPALEQAGLSFDVSNPLTAKLFADTGSQVTNIAMTTRANLMDIIGKSYQNGLTIPATRDLIREGMHAASKTRATMIARTEMARAVNGGSLTATQLVAQETGQNYNKVWHTAPGAKYPRHELYDGLDGQTVPMPAPFDVGGDQLQYPGDPNGEPGETINCRCALSYVEVLAERAPTPEPEELDADDVPALTTGLDPLPNTQDPDTLATVLESRAKRVEQPVSAIMKQVFADADARFAGFRWRLKTHDSAEQKLLADARDKGITPREDAYQLSDMLRYTATFEPERYVAGTREILRELEDRGFTIDRVRNTWSKDVQYAGINTRIAAPNGYRFELQFHTPASFDLKQHIQHKLYERYRKLDPASAEAKKLEAQMIENVRALDFPEGVEDFRWPETAGPAAEAPTLPAVPATQSIDIGITPFRTGEDNAVGFYESDKYRQFIKDINESAQAYGVHVDAIDKVTGVWEGDTEPSVSLRVSAADPLPKTVPPPIDFTAPVRSVSPEGTVSGVTEEQRARITDAVNEAYARMDQAGIGQDWSYSLSATEQQAWKIPSGTAGPPRHIKVVHLGRNEAAAQWRRETQTIELNVDSSEFPAETFAEDAAILAKGGIPKFLNKDLADTVIHEYGHAAQDAIGLDSKVQWRSNWEKLKTEKAALPSEYAGQAPQEAWGETFVALVDGYPQGAAFQAIMRPLLTESKVLPGPEDTYTYRIQHRAPDREHGAPMFDVTSGQGAAYPADFYDEKTQMQFYGQPRSVPAVPGGGYDLGALDQKAFDIVNKAHGDPTAMVTIYRAVPANVTKINPGDWVTPVKEYADLNAEAAGLSDEGAHVVSMQVPAAQVFTNGDSIAEWGWDPPDRAAFDLDARARAFAANLGRAYNQDGVLLFTPKADGDSLMATFTETLPQDKVTAAMEKAGISGGRFTPDGRLQVIGPRTEEFTKQIAAVSDELGGEKFEVARGEFAMMERDNGDYQKALDTFTHPKGATAFDVPQPEPPPEVKTAHGEPIVAPPWPEMDKIINAPAQKEWLDALSAEDKQLIDAYTQDGSHDINTYLAGHTIDDSNLRWYRNSMEVAKAAADMQKIVATAPPLPDGLTLYRAVNATNIDRSLLDTFSQIEQDVIDKMGLGNAALANDRRVETFKQQTDALAKWVQQRYPVGSDVHLAEPGEFTSMTSDPDIASEILTPAQPGVIFRVENAKTGATIWPYSAHVAEHEILAPPGTLYRVKDITINRMEGVFPEGSGAGPTIREGVVTSTGTEGDRVVVTVEEVVPAPSDAAVAAKPLDGFSVEYGDYKYAPGDLRAGDANLVGKSMAVTDKNGDSLGHFDWYTKKDDPGHIYIGRIELEDKFRGQGYARAMLARLSQDQGGLPIVHGDFSTLEGVRFGVGMAYDHPDWNLLRLGSDESGNPVFWTPGTPIDPKVDTFLIPPGQRDQIAPTIDKVLARPPLQDRPPDFVGQYVSDGLTPPLSGDTTRLFPGQADDVAKSAAAHREAAIAQYARDNNMSVADYKAAATEAIRSYVASHPQIRIRLAHQSLTKVLKDGRFKSEFELPGLPRDAVEPRITAEKNLFGYSADADPATRPIYGYLAGTADETGVVQEYGDMIVNLDPTVNARASFTIGDSYNAAFRSDLSPTLLGNPGIGSWDGSFDIVKAWREGDIGQISQYVEVEIHGGLPTSDIGGITPDEALIVSREDAERLKDATEALTELAANYEGTQQASPQVDEAGIPLEKPQTLDLAAALTEIAKNAALRQGALAELLARVGLKGKLAHDFVDFSIVGNLAGGRL